MSRKLRYWYLPLAAATLLFAAPAAAFADAIPSPEPIGPATTFTGLVNGQSSDAVIKVVCLESAPLSGFGRPVAGQTVSALPIANPTTKDFGYTGLFGRQIDVSFGIAATAQPPAVLNFWGVAANLPTTLVVPCSGTGTVTFTPVPNDPTSRSTTVDVTFVS